MYATQSLGSILTSRHWF